MSQLLAHVLRSFLLGILSTNWLWLVDLLWCEAAIFLSMDLLHALLVCAGT